MPPYKPALLLHYRCIIAALSLHYRTLHCTLYRFSAFFGAQGLVHWYSVSLSVFSTSIQQHSPITACTGIKLGDLIFAWADVLLDLHMPCTLQHKVMLGETLGGMQTTHKEEQLTTMMVAGEYGLLTS